MNGFETIRRWAVLLLAEVLNLSARAAEKVLSGQPRWLAHLRLLEENLREGAGRPAGEPRGEPRDDAVEENEGPDLGPARQMLESYAVLNRALRDVEARGLALDDALVERMKNEWSAGSIVGYLRTCDTQLKQRMGETLNAAAAILGQDERSAQPQPKSKPQPKARPKSKPATRGAAAGARKAAAKPERRKDLAS